ncbi:MAG: hypothetical protein GY851_07745, partial [bacterium]|nr:hypothetical protein [bacterium]
PKNWRPTTLVFAGNPEVRETLVTYAVWFEAGHGFVFLINVLVGSEEEYGKYRETARTQLLEFCEERRIQAFPVVVVDDNLEHAMTSAIQTLGVGPIRPNVAVFGWSDDPERLAASVGQYRTAQAMGMSLVVLHPGTRPFGHGHKRVDIWWRGMKNGALMLLLGHLLTRNWEWSQAEVRLLRVLEKEEGHEEALADLRRLIESARVKASAKVVVSDQPFADMLKDRSSDADCVVLGCEAPEAGGEAVWHERYRAMFCEAPTTVLVCATGEEDLMA